MSSALSKRQQARNEKALQDLLNNVPGNNVCADCQARNPSWASWSLGIFLCMRCATIHRKLGTHVSKVKSLTMDSWTNEQVDNMRKVGNVVSNKLYNPDNKKPPVPVDADEADSAMERFIRQKYIARALSTSKRRSGAGENDENPPPLPPKTPSRFGLRSASSLFPLGSKSKKESSHEPTSPRDPEPSLRDRSSQVFGATVDRERVDVDDKARKLAKLRDMGFMDESRNEMVLKGVNWNLERAIETLIRLGEGTQRSSSLLGTTRSATMPVTRSLTSSASSEAPRARPISPASTNPFDMLDAPPPPQPLSTQSTGTLQTKNPYLSTNPFGQPQQTPSALDLAFQNMSLAPTSQPLFPHHTGGLAQHPSSPGYQNPLTGPLTAPLPQATQGFGPQGYSGMATNGSIFAQPTGPAMTNYNPFFTAQTQPQQLQPQQQQQQQYQQPLTVNTTQFGGAVSSNPFARSPTRMTQSPTLTQIPEQAQQTFYAQSVQGLPAQTTNPFFNQMAATQTQQMYPGQAPLQIPQPTGLVPQMTGYMQQQQPLQRPDKAAILALYNYPPPAKPQQPGQDAGQGQTQQNSLFPQPQPQQQQQQQQPPPQQSQQPPLQQPTPVNPAATATATVGASKNPFATAGTAPTAAAAGPAAQTSRAEVAARHNVSRDSIMALGLDWSNGRHSPDAFASLSARNAR
ncbi:hypothetical protein VTJ49DRAFT_5333 [Mycothermus thermophilus]|uniref:UBA domain-containing protein 3 n=1 Tax=Humicola insolens TaxID=85995 RepID=A0ABR3V3F7_HUMIN